VCKEKEMVRSKRRECSENSDIQIHKYWAYSDKPIMALSPCISMLFSYTSIENVK